MYPYNYRENISHQNNKYSKQPCVIDKLIAMYLQQLLTFENCFVEFRGNKQVILFADFIWKI